MRNEPTRATGLKIFQSIALKTEKAINIDSTSVSFIMSYSFSTRLVNYHRSLLPILIHSAPGTIIERFVWHLTRGTFRNTRRANYACVPPREKLSSGNSHLFYTPLESIRVRALPTLLPCFSSSSVCHFRGAKSAKRDHEYSMIYYQFYRPYNCRRFRFDSRALAAYLCCPISSPGINQCKEYFHGTRLDEHLNTTVIHHLSVAGHYYEILILRAIKLIPDYSLKFPGRFALSGIHADAKPIPG